MGTEQFAEYVEHIADRRLGRLDLPEQYGTDNPFPWMSGVSQPEQARESLRDAGDRIPDRGSLDW